MRCSSQSPSGSQNDHRRRGLTAQARDSPSNTHESLPVGQLGVQSDERRMPAQRGQGRIRSNMRGPEGPALFGGEQAQSLLDQLDGALAVRAGALGVDPRGIVEQSR